jgi:hypothetical protein
VHWALGKEHLDVRINPNTIVANGIETERRNTAKIATVIKAKFAERTPKVSQRRDGIEVEIGSG